MVTHISIPLTLTLIRLFFTPLVFPIILMYATMMQTLFFEAVVALLFLGLCLTDFFDGFLARKWMQETQLGKFLDPIADKSLLYSSLIALLVVGRIHFFWVILLIGREFFVMGLRIIASENNLSIEVSQWGKAKTVALSVYLLLLVCQRLLLPFWWFSWIRFVALIASLTLSFFSAYLYGKEFWNQIEKRSYESTFK